MIKKIDLGNNSYFIGENFSVGDNFRIGHNNTIRARSFRCGSNVLIGSNNNFLIGKEIKLGTCSYIGNNNDVTGLKVTFGEYLYLDSNVVIGHGGKMNYASELEVGHHCMVCAYVKLNINYRIEIGDDVGIGEYVDIWTHGSFPPVLQGFPSQFGSVSIGSNVWLPAKSTVMPGVTIGDNVVIGANSLINRNLPTGSLCAGMPVKVLRENLYPKDFSSAEKAEMIRGILGEYEKLRDFKEIDARHSFDGESLVLKTDTVKFDFKDVAIDGELSDTDEDLRDFLRRRGIKFFTGKPFRSITPPIYKDLISYE